MDQPTHKLSLLDRKKLAMTGVEEVVSFDDTAVVLSTCLGRLTIEGRELHLKTLTLEGGQVDVEGSISSLSYEEPREGGSWLARLLR